MTDMPMHGGPTSLSAATSFLGMWIVMMVAMMLPSLAPTLWRYRRALETRGIGHVNRLTLAAGSAYFLVWTMIGVAIHPILVALTSARQHVPVLARTAPLLVALVVVAAGVVQLSGWKARHLARCRAAGALGHAMRADRSSAWRHGLCLGRCCTLSCAGPMASLIAIGMMDVRVVAIVTAAITLERLAPTGERVARGIGVGAVALGALMVVRAIGWLGTPG